MLVIGLGRRRRPRAAPDRHRPRAAGARWPRARDPRALRRVPLALGAARRHPGDRGARAALLRRPRLAPAARPRGDRSRGLRGLRSTGSRRCFAARPASRSSCAEPGRRTGGLPAARRGSPVTVVARRYGRPLGIELGGQHARWRSVSRPSCRFSFRASETRNLRVRVRPQRRWLRSSSPTVIVSTSHGHSRTTSAVSTSPASTARFSAARASLTRLASASARMCCGDWRGGDRRGSFHRHSSC